MSLATRCSACGTVFRVVKDQLLVSDGWVRCGRCQQVFNALEGLFDLERDGTPPPRSANPPSPAVQRVLEELSRHTPSASPAQDRPTDTDGLESPESPAVPEASSLGPAEDPGAGVVMSPSLAAALDPNGAGPLGSAHAAHATADHGIGPAAGADASAAVDHGNPFGALLRPAAADAAAADSAPVIAADERPPQFVQAADRSAYWRRPGVRAALGTLVTLLALVLMAQAAWYWRDRIAARWPESQPWLEMACAPLHCRVQPLAGIEHLSVDGSALTRVDGTSLHRLGVTLRNRSDLALRAPAIELTLTDLSGSVVARRVLTLADFGQGAVRLEAGQELALTTTLAMAAGSDRRIGGYTVELFYP